MSAPDLNGVEAMPARSGETPTLHSDALHGLPGRVVAAVGPHTEADPAAVLVSFLAAAGAMFGPDRFALGGDVEHGTRIWPLIIGRTAGGMKGTSWATVQRVLLAADPLFSAQIARGLSSGEGLIERVRDGHGRPDDKDFDEGVRDKRLLVVESEFAGVLGRSKREGNSLSETLREAWDGGRLSTMTRKSSQLVATGSHVVLLGHITPTELRAKLSESDVAGGLMNRFLPVHSQRSKRLPEGGSTPPQIIGDLGAALLAAVTVARSGPRTVIARDPDAATLWRDEYDNLTPDLEDGHLAAVVARAVPQVTRLALIYCLLDQDTAVRPDHLRAALAVWHYAEESARLVFGDLTVGRDLGKLSAAIDAAGEQGMTRAEIGKLFDGHKPRIALDEMLARLEAGGDYQRQTKDTGGRPLTRYVRDKRDKRDNPPPKRDNSLPSLISQHATGDSAEDKAPCGHPLSAVNTSNGKCGLCILGIAAFDQADNDGDLYQCPTCGTPTRPSRAGHASLCLACSVAEIAADADADDLIGYGEDHDTGTVVGVWSYRLQDRT